MEEEKKVRVISKETLNKLLQCFSEPSEMGDFCLNMNILSYQIAASSQVGVSSEEEAVILGLRQIAHFANFCQQNIEVVRDLIQVCSVEEFTEAELERMNQPECQ